MLDSKLLAKNIASSLATKHGSDKAYVFEVWKTVAEAICEHIRTNGEVQAGIKVDTPQGPGLTTSKGKIV